MTDNTAVEAAHATANLNDALAGNIERSELRPMPDDRTRDDEEPTYRNEISTRTNTFISAAGRYTDGFI